MNWEMCELVIRFSLSTWLVLVGVTYILAAIGATTHPPSLEWGWMVLGLVSIKTGHAIASEFKGD